MAHQSPNRLHRCPNRGCNYSIIRLYYLLSLTLFILIISANISFSQDTFAPIRTIDSTKQEVSRKVELDNPFIADTAMTIAKNYPGDYTINQVSAIYKTLASGGWYYYSEGTDADYFQNANLTLQRGMLSDTTGRGDCDDFAILMASLVGSIGGSTRITFAWGKGGHAYAEVYLGKKDDQNVEQIKRWIEEEYGKENLSGLNYTGDEVWLNLDWGSDYTKSSFPGGPHFGESDAKYKIYVIWDSGTRRTPLIVPIIDDMDNIDGWEKIVDDKGSSANITSGPGKIEPGRENMALRMSFDLKEGGWVGARKDIDPELLSQAAGLNISFFNSGSADAIEIRLTQKDDTTFGSSWNVATKNRWSYHRVLYSQLDCPSNSDKCNNHSDSFDIHKINKIEFRALNTFYEDDDLSSTGILLLDRIEGAMAIPLGSPWENAENARRIYQAKSLAVQSKTQLEESKDNLRESALSAMESLSLHPTPDACEALSNCLVLMPKKVAQYERPRSSYWDRSPLDIEFAPKGIFMSPSAENLNTMLWDWKNNVSHPISKEKVWGNIISYDPELNRLAIAGTGGRVAIIINLVDGNIELKINSTVNDISHLQFLYKGEYLAVGSPQKVEVWNLSRTDGMASPRLDGSISFPDEYQASDLTFSPDSRYMAVADTGGSIEVWNWSEGKKISTMDAGATKYSVNVNSVSFSQDSRMLATGSWYQGAKIWDIYNEKELASLDESYNVLKVLFSSQGSLLATANEFQKDKGTQYSLKVWDLGNISCPQSAKELMVINSLNAIDEIAFSPDGRYLAASFIDRRSNNLTVSVWDIATFKEAILESDYDLYTSTISPDGKYVAASSWRGTPLTWDWRNGTTFENRSLSSAHGVDFGPQTGIIAIAGTDGYVRVLSPSIDKELSNLYSDGFPMDVDFDGTENYLAVGNDGGDVLVWEWRKDLSASNPVRMDKTSFDSLRDVEFSPSGKEIGIVYEYGGVGVWTWDRDNAPKFMDIGGERVIASCRFSPNGSILYIGYNAGNVTLWDWSNSSEIGSFPGTDSLLVSMAISHDGEFLATGDFNGIARIWNLKDGSEVVRLNHNDEVTGIEFSADGRYLATSSADKTIRVWLWRPEDMMNEAIGRLGYDLTPAEQFAYPSIKGK